MGQPSPVPWCTGQSWHGEGTGEFSAILGLCGPFLDLRDIRHLNHHLCPGVQASVGTVRVPASSAAYWGNVQAISLFTRYSPSQPSPVPWCTGQCWHSEGTGEFCGILGQSAGHSLIYAIFASERGEGHALSTPLGA